MQTSSRTFATVLLVVTFLLVTSARATERLRHTVDVDGHPFAIWEKSADGADEAILLVHGRTWSAVPDFDLQVEGEDLSFMEGLVEAGYATYAIDLRGYGETPRDPSGWMTPWQAARDVAAILEWVGAQREWHVQPHLLGWSMGSTISHLAAQSSPTLLSSLTLYGFWKDLDVTLRDDDQGMEPARLTNTAEAAASDFITPGSISQRAIDTFVDTALATNPVKTDIRSLSDYNDLDPASLSIPTLVIVGEFDPIAPQEYQAKLFTRIGTGHKQWVSVPGGDHAAHLEVPRGYFLSELITFLRGAGI